ncbi:hypothetical protein FHN55_05630 [Streptomyces sp. NP160]|uniref:hypothetical protein n=1 Tax=Streptomyces sp. NP160 TaxID=2586637 RepID=UPI001119FDED|nr:hypothetical protein [Streptomyces sp. NP160]TNM68919.1 hypothetical protein FHN55_05630 [Streptomyces sp. NP160]
MLHDPSRPAPAADPARDAAQDPAPGTGLAADRRLRVRQALLEVCVLDDVDLVPAPDGLLLTGPHGPRHLSAQAAAAVVGDRRSDDPDTRPRLRSWLRAHSAVTPEALRGCLRPLALPRDGALHPGPAWVRATVHGGALDVGLGLVGAVPGEADPVPVWPDLLARLDAEAVAAGQRPLDAGAAWRSAAAHLEAAGRVAAQRVERELRARVAEHEALQDPDHGPAQAVTVVEPTDGCDALTLLASAPLRRWLAEADGTGLRVVAVPSRMRGWTDLARIDADFVAAAWAATEPDRRGLSRPALVTRDEVALAPRWVR